MYSIIFFLFNLPKSYICKLFCYSLHVEYVDTVDQGVFILTAV